MMNGDSGDQGLEIAESDTRAVAYLSEAALEKIWDNADDVVYDRLPPVMRLTADVVRIE